MCGVLVAVWCAVFVVSCLLRVVRRLQFVVCCSLRVRRCAVCVVCCLLFVV